MKDKEPVHKNGENQTTAGTNGEIGTGFGLLLAKEFVDMHDGKIWAEKNEGNGVTFKISLPSV